MPGEFTGATPFTKTAAQGTRSPLAAVESWLYVGLSYRISYAAQSVPSALLAKIGTLIKAPPNIGKFKLPEAAQKRRWLVMAPKASIRGNTAQITEEYLLSEPGGLPDAIYGFGQLS